MFLEAVRAKVNKICFYRRTLWGMALKQLKAKYAGSVLGFFWAIVNPILLMLAITFVFTIVFKAQIKGFSLFVLSGILPWMFFSGAVSEATPSLPAQNNVLHQFSLPKEIIPFSIVLSYLLNFLMSWIVIYPIFLLYNPAIARTAIYLPLALILTYLFISGAGLLFSVLNVIFRDLEHLVATLLMFWFWVTPIFYSIDMIPKSFHWIFNLNPLCVFVLFYRDIIFYGRVPGLPAIAGMTIWALGSISAGVLVSTWLESDVLKRI
jgi:ABC-2 type transport system permease protein